MPEWLTWLLVGKIVIVFVFIIMVLSSIMTVEQAEVVVIHRFGKFARIGRSGLNFMIPIIESMYAVVQLKQDVHTVKFETITQDQAVVGFETTILVQPFDDTEETLKKIAYKFVTREMYQQALAASLEASARAFVSGKKQSEILGMRTELVKVIKTDIDEQFESWGQHLVDLQINNISFAKSIMESMENIVAAKNALIAAETEGQALLVRKTKEAEAVGKAIVIAAQAEATAAQERGRGLAKFREEVGKGLGESVKALESQGISGEFMTLAMWTETLRDVAKDGKGNTIFLDGSTDGMKRLLASTAHVK